MCPRIEAVEKCLNSRRSRSLSYGGKAVVSNALALSRVWYVASLVPMPPWALSELNSLRVARGTLLPVMLSFTLVKMVVFLLYPLSLRFSRSCSVDKAFCFFS